MVWGVGKVELLLPLAPSLHMQGLGPASLPGEQLLLSLSFGEPSLGANDFDGNLLSRSCGKGHLHGEDGQVCVDS